MKNFILILVILMTLGALPVQAQGEACGDVIYVYDGEMYRGDEVLTALPGFDFSHEADPQNEWLVFSNKDENLYRVRLDGTGLERLTNTDDLREWYVDWSPDGEYVAWVADINGTSNSEIFVMDRDADNIVQLTTGAGFKQITDWVGEWLYYIAGTSNGAELWRAHIDGSRSNVIVENEFGVSYLDYSDAGVFYAINIFEQAAEIYHVQPDGTNNELIYDGILEAAVSVSLHSDDYLYFKAYGPKRNVEGTPNSHLFRMDFDGRGLVQITNFDGEIHDARWGPDGDSIIIEQGVMEFGWNDIFLISPDGAEITTISEGGDYFRTWDGDAVIVSRIVGPGASDLFRIAGDSEEKQLTSFEGFTVWVGCSGE